MPVIAGTFQTTSAKTNREELHDIVSRMTPEDTPIYSMAEKVTFSTPHPEWATDDLAAPADNAQTEGDEYAFDTITPPARFGNYTQIFRKGGVISGTQEKTSNAGDVLTLKTQVLKRGIELRKDVEYSIVAANASVGGTTRYSGSLSTWITSNVSRGGGGANGGFNTTTGLTVAPTNGTQRAFTKTLLDNVMQQGYQNGANFRYLVVSPYVKSVFVNFMSDANVAPFRTAVTDGNRNRIIANADIYEGPFGKVTVMPNRVMAGAAGLARNAFLIDPEHIAWGWLRRIARDKEVWKSGDAHKFMLLGEGALKVSNERGMGVVADVFGLTATT